jgi:hypothetical protein
MNTGNSVLNKKKDADNVFPENYRNAGNGGGNSGCVISPAPGLGLSAYQSPTVPVKKLPKRQGP